MEERLKFVISHWQSGVFDASRNYAVYRRKTGYGRQRHFMWWSIAAAVAAAVAIFAVVGRYNSVEEYHAGSYVTQVKLKDGTSVKLAPGASLKTWPRKTSRLVKMEGKVLFEVARDPDNPFVVKMENAAVKVLGTVFQVNAQTPQVRVDVTEGKVLFFTEEDEMVLVAGESAQLSLGEIVSVASVPNPIAWARGEFVYNAEELVTVLNELSGYFGRELTLENPQDGTRKISGSFPADSLEDVIDLIETAMDVKIVCR